VFARKDARLKHYRKHHEELVRSPAGSRGSPSQRPGSAVASQQLDSPSGGESHYSGCSEGQPNESQDGFPTINTFTHGLQQRNQDLQGLTYGETYEQ
jgi:hypothetical protein